MLTMDNKKFYELGLYEKSMPNTLSFREKLETVKATGFDFLEISIDENIHLVPTTKLLAHVV